jgi:tetratricopeptide (TPR) repeat protein
MKSETKLPKDSPFMKSVKNLDIILRVAGRLLILLLIIWILWAFRKAYLNDSYVIEPFSVPPSLAERGYTGEVVADKVMAEMSRILSKNYFDEQNPEAYRKIIAQPTLQFSSGSRAGYFDLESLFKLGKVVMGKKDKTIKGHITLDSNRLSLNLAMSDNTSTSMSINHKIHLDSLVHQAALFLIRRTNPQSLVYYFLNKQDYATAESLLQEIDFRLNNQKQSKTYTYDRIQWSMSWTNLKLAQQDFDGALAKAEALRQAYPKDLAADVQTVNILMTQVLHLEDAKTDPSVYRPLAERATALAEQIEKQNLSSLFLDKPKAMGWLYANWAYLIGKTEPNSADILPKYQKAIALLPNVSFAYNNLSYYYMDKKDYAAAEDALQKALFTEPKDGNALDTYAEIMSIRGDSIQFYAFIEKALQNPNPTEGITAEYYAQDKRWEAFRNRPRFQNLLKIYRK